MGMLEYIFDQTIRWAANRFLIGVIVVLVAVMAAWWLFL